MTNKKNEKKRDTGEKPHLKKKNAGSHPSHGLTCEADRVWPGRCISNMWLVIVGRFLKILD